MTRTPQEIRAERGYRRIDMTVAERDFLRGLVLQARTDGNDEATSRLLRILDTTFDKQRPGYLADGDLSEMTTGERVSAHWSRYAAGPV